jgi:hypothetical protein
MTIKITQTCNGCSISRTLSLGYRGDAQSLTDASRRGGWREVRDGVHLCTDCIDKAAPRS